jgi:hypothetical protein
MKPIVKDEHVKHEFSAEERVNLSNDLAQKTIELHTAEDDKKAVMSDFKSKIDGLNAGINSCAHKLQSGFEMREKPCLFEFNAENHTVKITVKETGELVDFRAMTQAERQMSFEDVE